MQASAGAQNIRELIEKQITLPKPPAVAGQILNAVQNEEVSLQTLAEIVSADPALTAKLLRFANSGVYGLQSQIASIERALSVLGTNLIKNLTLSFVIADQMQGGKRLDFDFNYFWRRAVTAAVAAQLLTRILGQKSEEIFVTALLQDIGILVMAQQKGQDYSRLLEERFISEHSLRDLEEQAFGFNHQTLGATLLQSWNLPETIYEPIRFHHDPEKAPELHTITARILLVSNQLSAIYNEANGAQKVHQLQEDLPRLFNISLDQARVLVDEVANQSIEILTAFDLKPGSIKPYSQMLQEANQELGRLNLSYEQLVLELKEAKNTAEQLSFQLREANTQLKEMIYLDSLTGLYNHRFFQETLDKELMRALRHQSSLGLIMADIDHFKTINDRFGHPAGDLVLQQLSQVLESSVRSSDIVARYGGEEFAIILPMTNEAGMKVFAERLRRKIEGTRIEIDGNVLPVTISVGGTCRTPEQPHMTKEKLIKTADQAMYQSKEAGRNHTSILSL